MFQVPLLAFSSLARLCFGKVNKVALEVPATQIKSKIARINFMLDSFVFFAMCSPLSSARLNALTQGTCYLIQICLYRNCFIQENNYSKGVKLLLLPTRDKE